jgi:hypothetical protein
MQHPNIGGNDMDITIEDLRRYRAIIATITSIDAEIEAAYSTVSSPTPSEVVAGRSSVRPAGDPVGSALHRVESLRRKQAKLVEEKEAIEAFVDGCTDDMAQAIMRMHFLAGKSWRKTAVAVYGYIYADGETCRKYVQRFFKSL